jgi:hypothetical protein
VEEILQQRAEALRLQMAECAARTGSLHDRSVVELSQQLDQIIVQLQKMKMHVQ